jgi:hypothetical protein
MTYLNNIRQKRMHIVVGTPMYGGMCTSEYTESLLNFVVSADKSGIECTTIFLGNESLIQRGRNTIAHHFMNIPGATHLLFIDADIKFRTQDIVKMLKADKPLIVSPVPLKGYNWQQIRQKALDGVEDIQKTGGVFNIGYIPGIDMVDPDTPFEIKHGGTALMLIKREVFEKLDKSTPTYLENGKSLNYGKKVKDYFRVEIDKEQNELLSEDYFFCQSYRKVGGKVWCAPWTEVGHFGSHLFSSKYNI